LYDIQRFVGVERTSATPRRLCLLACYTPPEGRHLQAAAVQSAQGGWKKPVQPSIQYVGTPLSTNEGASHDTEILRELFPLQPAKKIIVVLSRKHEVLEG
jgi:hypothetical protein